MELVRGRPGVASVEPHGDFSISITTRHEGGGGILVLDNLFDELRDVPPDEKDGLLMRWVESVIEARQTPEDWPSAAPMLLPAIRCATYGLSLEVTEERHAMVKRPILPFINEHVVVDEPGRMGYVNNELVDKWGQSKEVVYSRALENAAVLAEGAASILDDTHGPLWHVDTGDAHESTRLIIPGFLASFRERVEGRPVAIVPERSQIYIGGDARPDMVLRLAERGANEWKASPRSISPAIYAATDDGAVVPYHRDGSDQVASAVRLGHIMLANHEYGVHREVAQKALGDDVFLASYMAIERKTDRRPFSFVTWTENVPSFLPMADAVVFVRETALRSQSTLLVPWSDAVDLVDECWERAELLGLPFMRTKRWPDAYALKEIERRGIVGFEEFR